MGSFFRLVVGLKVKFSSEPIEEISWMSCKGIAILKFNTLGGIFTLKATRKLGKGRLFIVNSWTCIKD